MKSMTGYAKRQCEINGKKLLVEIKTLNSKQLDLNVKIPYAYREKDLEIRNLLNKLERGKVDLLMTEESFGNDERTLNRNLFINKYNELFAIGKELCGDAISPAETIYNLMRQDDIWSGTQNNEIDEESWAIIKKAIIETIDDVDTFRQHEGDILEQDFVKHVDAIETRLHQIPQFENQRIDSAKDRIQKYFSEFAIKEIDPNRFEQELIYYLEKLDITEEKVRLQKHIDYFRTTMKEPGCGKKLGFVAQEMGREINTTGSKANHVDIQKLVVEMKDELEKIKEQLGNIL